MTLTLTETPPQTASCERNLVVRDTDNASSAVTGGVDYTTWLLSFRQILHERATTTHSRTRIVWEDIEDDIVPGLTVAEAAAQARQFAREELEQGLIDLDLGPDE